MNEKGEKLWSEIIGACVYGDRLGDGSKLLFSLPGKGGMLTRIGSTGKTEWQYRIPQMGSYSPFVPWQILITEDGRLICSGNQQLVVLRQSGEIAYWCEHSHGRGLNSRASARALPTGQVHWPFAELWAGGWTGGFMAGDVKKWPR